jgi:type IV secretion system protein VirB1
MLDLPAILSLSVACAPGVAPETLAAIAWTESRFDPLAIGVNRGPRPGRRARDAADAARIARALLARGANLDLGVAQINSANLLWLGLSVEDAFDPCRNLAAAGRVLRTGYRLAPGETPQAGLRRALSRYNTGHPRRGFANGYVGRVEAAAARLGLTSPVAALAEDSPSAPTPAPPVETVEPPAWDVFARAASSTVVTFRLSAPSWSSAQ